VNQDDGGWQDGSRRPDSKVLGRPSTSVGDLGSGVSAICIVGPIVRLSVSAGN